MHSKHKETREPLNLGQSLLQLVAKEQTHKHNFQVTGYWSDDKPKRKHLQCQYYGGIISIIFVISIKANNDNQLSLISVQAKKMSYFGVQYVLHLMNTQFPQLIL